MNMWILISKHTSHDGYTSWIQHNERFANHAYELEHEIRDIIGYREFCMESQEDHLHTIWNFRKDTVLGYLIKAKVD